MAGPLSVHLPAYSIAECGGVVLEEFPNAAMANASPVGISERYSTYAVPRADTHNSP